MQAATLLFSQGFGTRRTCAALCHAGRLSVRGQVVDDPAAELELAPGQAFEVDGQAWPYHPRAWLMLHKPAGVECSRAPRDHASVLGLLPAPLRERGVQPVGRLDVDATGLLMLTDDGPMLHRLTSPKRHVAKVYEVTARHPVDEAQLQALRSGVRLHGDTVERRAHDVLALGGQRLRLTLTEGKYHQVKRMVAAAGNRVEALHRVAFGPWALPDDLAPGQWRWAPPATGL